VAAPRETQAGINKAEVMAAFAGLLKIDLALALDKAEGVFGDEGARVKGSARQTKNKALWNPVTLALGLNDLYRVPLPQLRRAFKAHDSLYPWAANWERTLALLGH
jgi:hypothetical protein